MGSCREPLRSPQRQHQGEGSSYVEGEVGERVDSVDDPTIGGDLLDLSERVREDGVGARLIELDLGTRRIDGDAHLLSRQGSRRARSEGERDKAHQAGDRSENLHVLCVVLLTLIGSGEGASTCWRLDEVEHPSSTRAL